MPGAAARDGSAARVASLLLLAAWLGAALLTAAVVAPAAFAVLPTRALAGALVGRVLPAIFLSGAATGGIVAVAEGARRGPGGRRGRAMLVAALLLAAGCLLAQLGISPRIERLRAEAGAPIDKLAVGDPRRVAFGRLHGASVVALGVSMLAGAVALAIGGRAFVPPPHDPTRPR